MENFLEARHIVKRFAKHTALNDVSVEVPRGQIFGLLGPNGAGKTTLIRILNRITAPDQGEVFFDGRLQEPTDVQRIGYLPEERGLYKKMKVGEQAIYLAQLKGLSRSEAEMRLRTWFEKFDIMPWWNKKLEELSKGMAQKVQFIITVLHEPDLLIFDEPFSGFDPVNAEQLKQEILELKEKGHTIIFSTHNMSSVEEICDTIALINHSQVVLKGNVQEVKSQFRTGLYDLVTTSASLQPVDGVFSIIGSRTISGVQRYSLRKAEAVDNNQLVEALARQVEIRSFAEQMPTMNDVFLNVVGQDATWADQQIENK